MLKIYKYEIGDPLPLNQGVAEVRMPKEATPISVGEQGGKIVVWAIVDMENFGEFVQFAVRGTGCRINEPLGRFLGTVFVGPLVWHVFVL